MKFSFPIKMIYEVLWNKSTEMEVTRRTRFLWDKVCFHDELSQINELVKVQIVTKIVTKLENEFVAGLKIDVN